MRHRSVNQMRVIQVLVFMLEFRNDDGEEGLGNSREAVIAIQELLVEGGRLFAAGQAHQKLPSSGAFLNINTYSVFIRLPNASAYGQQTQAFVDRPFVLLFVDAGARVFQSGWRFLVW